MQVTANAHCDCERRIESSRSTHVTSSEPRAPVLSSCVSTLFLRTCFSRLYTIMRYQAFLDPATFVATFGMDLAAFHNLPKWKQVSKKKEFDLF